MSFTFFVQVFFNIVVLTLIFVVFARLRRPAKDDPRLSKGLQLLSSKIAVLEDLNDRTESQVQQMLTLLDQKSRELQQKIMNAENQVLQIQQSMNQSLEVAQIFQDKIPHSEIIERQNSMKYIRAARLAHQGLRVEEIMREVDLPRGEIEFITKVNREQLSFREEDLPAWAKSPDANSHITNSPMANSPMANSPMANSPMANSPPPEVAFDAAAFEPRHMASTALPAEAAEIVERLNKLQFEMKNLDMELSSRHPEPAVSNTPQPQVAVLPPVTEADRLAELGKQFRQAVTPQATHENALQAARMAASQLSAKVSPPATSTKPVGSPQPAIRRVEFPRI